MPNSDPVVVLSIEMIQLIIEYASRNTSKNDCLRKLGSLNKQWHALVMARALRVLILNKDDRHGEVYRSIKPRYFHAVRCLYYELCHVHPRDLDPQFFKNVVSLRVRVTRYLPAHLFSVGWENLRELYLYLVEQPSDDIDYPEWREVTPIAHLDENTRMTVPALPPSLTSLSLFICEENIDPYYIQALSSWLLDHTAATPELLRLELFSFSCYPSVMLGRSLLERYRRSLVHVTWVLDQAWGWHTHYDSEYQRDLLRPIDLPKLQTLATTVDLSRMRAYQMESTLPTMEKIQGMIAFSSPLKTRIVDVYLMDQEDVDSFQRMFNGRQFIKVVLQFVETPDDVCFGAFWHLSLKERLEMRDTFIEQRLQECAGVRDLWVSFHVLDGGWGQEAQRPKEPRGKWWRDVDVRGRARQSPERPPASDNLPVKCRAWSPYCRPDIVSPWVQDIAVCPQQELDRQNRYCGECELDMDAHYYVYRTWGDRRDRWWL